MSGPRPARAGGPSCGSLAIERTYTEGASELAVLCRCRPRSLSPAKWWPWWRRRAPANRRSSTSPACSSTRTPARCSCSARPTGKLSDHGAHEAPPAAHRLRLPVPPSAAGVHGAGKRHDAAADPRHRARRGGAAVRPAARLHAGQAARGPPADGAFRRRAAARRHRARGGQRPAAAAGRRADRQPRPDHGGLRLRGADAAGPRLAARLPDRDPQSRTWPRVWTGRSPSSRGRSGNCRARRRPRRSASRRRRDARPCAGSRERRGPYPCFMDDSANPSLECPNCGPNSRARA